MFSFGNFPKNDPLWYLNTNAGTFWIYPTPAGKFLWGINDKTLGIVYSSPLALDFIRRQKTSHNEWDRLSPCPEVPPLAQWTSATGSGAFSYRYVHGDPISRAPRTTVVRGLTDAQTSETRYG